MELEHCCDSYGKSIKNWTTADFIIQENLYPPGFRTRSHATENAVLYFVLRGSYTENYAKDSKIRTARTLVFDPPDLAHSTSYHDDGASILRILVNSSRFDPLAAQLPKLGPCEFKNDILVWLATKLYHECHSSDPVSSVVVDGIALEILGGVLRNSVRPSHSVPVWLTEARDFIHARFNEAISLGEIAETVKIHPVYLATEFHRRYGWTIGDYVRHLRIQRTMHELTSSDVPLAVIALNAGFSSQSHFSRIFKRLVGVSPGQYRASSVRP
jgi:AraC family transcriptional regulator